MTKRQARERPTSELCRLLLQSTRSIAGDVGNDVELAVLELTTRAAAWDATHERMKHGNG